MERIITLIATLLILVFACDSTKKNHVSRSIKSEIIIPFTDSILEIVKIKNMSSYSSIDVYCYCFLNEPGTKNHKGETVRNFGMCTTPFRITPSVLAKPQQLLFTTTDSVVVNNFRNLMFEKVSIDTMNFEIDARFLLLLRKDHIEADTLVFIANNKFYFNNGFSLNYSVDVMESIRRIMKREKIECE